ncbi:MAG: polysaccharide deacetylase family protein [Candidatus Nomurabacteria bacterium]|nr:polysaccharide deacetylase family protein [Candidatus Nomurabacteria bacterium]
MKKLYKKRVSLVRSFLIILFIIIIGIYLINKRENPPIEENIKIESKVVYLTFDADMTPFMKKKLDTGIVSSYYSRELVSYLENEKIPATVFVTGMFAEIYPNLIKEMSKYPYIEVANHTYDHPGFEVPCYGLSVINTDKEKIQEMEKTQKILTTLTGHIPKYFRHPGLCHDNHDDILAQRLGLIVSDDGLTSEDAFDKNPNTIIKAVLNNIHDGSIVIMHLGGPNAPAIDVAIKTIVSKLKDQGYIFKTL